MIGSKVLHYQITEKLGEGGMGVVYKAEDTKLRRTVALKFLHPSVVGSAEEQTRLVNEARAAASLNHANICTIYDINEYEGQTFIAMEYIDGATLRDKVLSGRIEITDALRYAIQVANGLKQSHDKEQIHRDIKSANIMINAGGQAVIMDFGLARRADAQRADERLSSGGTSAYMSPEQARGEAVDQRTDIWSLGVVLYETIAGQLPFRGDYEQAVTYSILNEKPRPIHELRPHCPDDIVAIVERCLDKDPDERFQTLDDLIAEVRRALDDVTGGRRAGSAPVTHSQRSRFLAVPLLVLVALAALYTVYDFLGGRTAESEVRIPIAVADFRNETDETSLDGLSGMLITALEQSRRLEVMTRTGMFDVLKTLGQNEVTRIDESLGQEICRQSEIGALVVPTVRKFGNLYTIDLKVLDTRRNRYVFTTKEEGQGQESIPGMIDEIARRIRIDLQEDQKAVEAAPQIAVVTTVDLDAYQAYFRGDELLNKLEFKDAAKEFARAIELDSTFALAHYRLAYTEWWSGSRGEEAKSHARIAVENIDRIPDKERFLVRALQAGLEEGFDAQTPIFAEMRERYPNDKEMLFGLGDAEFHSDNFDSAEVHFARVLELDPEFERALQHLTWTYLRSDRPEQARDVAQRWVEYAGSVEAYESLASAHIELGEFDAAMGLLETALEKHPESYRAVRTLAELKVSAGDPTSAATMLGKMAQETESEEIRMSAMRDLAAGVYAIQGRFREAEYIYNTGIEYLTTVEPDTSRLVQVYLAKAALYYWAYQDMERAHETALITESFPDEYKKEGYWQTLAALCIITGDTTRARTIMDKKTFAKDDQTRFIFDMLMSSLLGDCAKGAAMLDTVRTNYKSIPSDRLTSLKFALGSCQLESGEYEAAIANLQEITSSKRMLLDFGPYYPAAHFLLAKAYDASGDIRKAIDQYRFFLTLWEQSDPDLPFRRDAEARVAELEAASNM